MKIREFVPEDWPEFVRLMRQLHQEGGLQNLKLSERYLLNSLKRPGLFHLMAFDDETHAVGVCMGWVEDTFFGPDLIGHQHMFYIAPEARGGLLAKRMMKEWEDWSIAQGAKELWVSQATGIEVERTEQFFNALGFETVGMIARKKV